MNEKEKLNKVHNSLKNELPNLKNITKIKKEMQETFKNMFPEETLKLIIENFILLDEYYFIKQNKDNVTFKKLFKNLLKIYEKCKNNNFKEFECIVKEHIKILSQSIDNYYYSYILEHEKDLNDINLFAQICFRDINSIIENSLKNFIIFFYKLDLSSRNSFNIEKQYAIGEAIPELIKINDFKLIYKKNLFEVSLNQWRNIACHNDYKILKNNIICNYGGNRENEIKIKKEELSYLLREINFIFGINKLVYTIICISNINSFKNIGNKMNDNTRYIYVSEMSHIYGFKIISYKKSKTIDIILEEFNKNNNNSILDLVNKIIPLFEKNVTIKVNLKNNTQISYQFKNKILFVKTIKDLKIK